MKRTVKRNFLYKGRRLKVVEVASEGNGTCHVFMGRKLISFFGFGTVEEVVDYGKLKVNDLKFNRRDK